MFANAVIMLVLALTLKVPWLRVAAAVAFLFTLSAMIGGFLFVLSGFRDDSSSYQMSTGFILAFAFTFLSVYLLRSSVPSPAPLVA